MDMLLYVTNFLQKPMLFNDDFAEQCTINDNSSTLPPMNFCTNSVLSNLLINSDEIVEIILKQKPHKAHGCDTISMAMLFPAEVAIPLSLIFQPCINTGKFPVSWKLANAKPIHVKKERQIKTNYRHISLLPLCGIFFEKKNYF